MRNLGEDPRAITNLILACGEEENLSFSNLAIQKLLYFCHASYLVSYRAPLVNGVFEAWEHGPVCRVIYDELKNYGRSKITERIVRRDIFTNEFSPISLPESRRINSHVYQTVSHLGKLSPGQLVNLSHKRGGAWDYIWNKSKTSATLGNRISNETILTKFSPLLPVPSKVESIEGDYYEATPFTGD